MSDKNIKQIRGQIRQIVKEEMPNILAEEMLLAIHKKLSEQITQTLQRVSDEVKETLQKLDNRSKDIQNYVVRSSLPNNPKE